MAGIKILFADSRLRTPVNFILYQLTWFACVMGAASNQPWVGIGVALMVIGLHLGMSQNLHIDLRIIGLTGLIGGLWETFLVNQHWVEYLGRDSNRLPPLWIIALWLAFATTFNVSLRWLQGRYVLAALFGMLGGPLAWYAGMRLGALSLPSAQTDLTAIGLGWAVLMPLMLFLTGLMNRPEMQPQPEKSDV